MRFIVTFVGLALLAGIAAAQPVRRSQVECRGFIAAYERLGPSFADALAPLFKQPPVLDRPRQNVPGRRDQVQIDGVSGSSGYLECKVDGTIDHLQFTHVLGDQISDLRSELVMRGLIAALMGGDRRAADKAYGKALAAAERRLTAAKIRGEPNAEAQVEIELPAGTSVSLFASYTDRSLLIDRSMVPASRSQ